MSYCSYYVDVEPLCFLIDETESLLIRLTYWLSLSHNWNRVHSPQHILPFVKLIWPLIVLSWLLSLNLALIALSRLSSSYFGCYLSCFFCYYSFYTTIILLGGSNNFCERVWLQCFYLIVKFIFSLLLCKIWYSCY